MPRPRAPRSLAALSLALLGACAGMGTEPEPSWVHDEFEVASGRILWEYTILALEKSGYPVGGGIDPTELEVLTGWQTHLSPFKDEGFRARAEMRVVPIEAGRYRVEARVQRQGNAALVRPTDPRYAEWKWIPEDTVAASVLLQHVGAYVAPKLQLDEP